MKISVEGFNQRYACSFKKEYVENDKIKTKKLDCTDLVILRWFVDFYPKMKKMVIDNKEYVWLSYQKLIEDLPIIDISKRTLASRLQKLVEFEILDYKFIKENGSFTLFSFGSNYEKLIIDGGCKKNDNGCLFDDNGVVEKTTTKNKTIKKYKENKDNKLSLLKENKFIPPTIEEIKEYCESINLRLKIEKFYDYYESNGWKVGKNKMVDWKATVRRWGRDKNNLKEIDPYEGVKFY